MKFFATVALLAVSSANAEVDCCGIKSGGTCPDGTMPYPEIDTHFNGVWYTGCCADGNADGTVFDDINMCDGAINPASVSTQGAVDCCGIKSGGTCPAGTVLTPEIDTVFNGVSYTGCCADGNADGKVWDDINMCPAVQQTTSTNGGTTSTNGDTTQDPVIDGCCGTFTGTCPTDKALVTFTIVEGEKLEVCCAPDETKEIFALDIQGCETGAPVIATDPSVQSTEPVSADDCCSTTAAECPSDKTKVGFNPFLNVCCEFDGDIFELEVADLNTCTATADVTDPAPAPAPSSAAVVKAAAGMVVAAVATLVM